MRATLSALVFAAALGLLATSLGGVASAAPTARFTATPVQGSTCVAPCVVHLDATATTATDTTRPFHELDYDWDCGEPAAGSWPTKLGGSKNTPRGPISGCVYDTPGNKTIRLTARSADGTSHAATQVVNVVSPRTHFAGAGTYCFRSTATGDFLGCPLDADTNGSCELDPGGHCATQASFTTALDTCGADSAQRGCYFRRGDTFSGGSAFVLHGGGTTPGVVGSFGPTTRARPVISGSRGLVSLRSRWTVHGLTAQIISDSIFNQVGHGENNITVYQVGASGPTQSCMSMATGGGTLFNDLIAAVEFDCNSTAIDASAMFLRAERGLVLGSRIDSNGTGEFNLRTVHWWKGAIQHSDLVAPGNPANGGSGDRNPLQIRAWAQSSNEENPSGVGPPPKETRWVTISDNYFEWHGGDNAGVVIRTCQNNDCGAQPGGTGSGDPQDVVDLLIERNFAAFDGSDSRANLSSGFVWAQGGRITVRNNVLDLQGISNISGTNRVLRQSPTYDDCDGCTGSEIVVQNNTVYYDEALGDPFDLCELNEGAGHVCQLNLVWRPSDTATGGSEAPGVPAATGGNLYATANPFTAAPPNRGLTLPSHFQLSSTSAARNRLGSPSRDIVIDHGRRCRTGSIDAGAWEQGASACSGTTGPVCGNSQVESGETCDDGNTAVGDGCSAVCQVEPAVCGNNRVDAGETCDDGNSVAGDGCRANCTQEVCGDRIVDFGEMCDDGNAVGGDGCRADCNTEACGNGALDAAEGCDDGNAESGDGCSAGCLIEIAPGAGLYRLNVGGAAYSDPSAQLWSPDSSYVSGGRIATHPIAILNTISDPLYQSRRYGALGANQVTFELPVPTSGPYQVRLHFAELEVAAFGVGRRVFDVVLEDFFRIEDIDVYAAIGHQRVYTREIFLNVDDGSLSIRLEPQIGEAMLSAIETSLQSSPTDSPRFIDPCADDPGSCPPSP